MTRRSFFRNFGGLIASVAIAQKVVVDFAVESSKYLRLDYLVKLEEYKLPLTPVWYQLFEKMEWKNDILNADGTFKKNLGNTIRSVV